jgi:hypothetical protein
VIGKADNGPHPDGLVDRAFNHLARIFIDDVENFLDQPVICSAVGFINSTRASMSVAITASPILARVVRSQLCDS